MMGPFPLFFRRRCCKFVRRRKRSGGGDDDDERGRKEAETYNQAEWKEEQQEHNDGCGKGMDEGRKEKEEGTEGKRK